MNKAPIKNQKKPGDCRVLISGSFDPITVGHYDVIRRASEAYREVIVCVFVNPDKTPMFSLDERRALLETACAGLPNVRVDSDTGMLADYVKRNAIDVVVKGYRNVSDIRYELGMAYINEQNAPGSRTVLLPSDQRYDGVSSTLVKEIILSGGDFSPLVPEGCEKAIKYFLK